MGISKNIISGITPMGAAFIRTYTQTQFPVLITDEKPSSKDDTKNA